MKNGLVLFAAIIFFLICPLTVIRREDNWVERCMSEYHSILGCAAKNFDPLIPVDPECCKIIDDFDRACVSKSKSTFQYLEYSFLWIKKRCASPNPSNPPSVPPPSPPSPTETVPPPPPSSSSPPPVPSSDQTPWQRLQVYPPEPLPMPDATGLWGTWRGCGKDHAAESTTSKEWDFPNNRTSCTVIRYIGIYCDTGKPLDTIDEFCCMLNKDIDAVPVGKCMNVKPLIVSPGQHSPPPPQIQLRVDPPEPLPVPDATGLWGQWAGCGEGNAAENSISKC